MKFSNSCGFSAPGIVRKSLDCLRGRGQCIPKKIKDFGNAENLPIILKLFIR